MSLRTRLFVEHPLSKGCSISLNEEQSHYLSNVLRFKTNELLRVFNGIDGEWEAVLNSATKKQATIKLTSQITPQINENRLHLAFCPVKAVTPSFIIQKATELGVTDIWPIISKRTVVHKVNIEKLSKTTIEAVEQSERLNIPKIRPIQKLSDFLRTKKFTGKLIFCYEGELAFDFTTFKDKLQQEDNCILIGPEGGFDAKEAAYIKALDYTLAVNFGRRIMRAETAGIAAISSYNTLMNNWI